MNHDIDKSGFEIIPEVVDASALRDLLGELGHVSGAGRRGLMSLQSVSAVANSEPLLKLVRLHLPSRPLPVRAIYFDKSPEANWLVSWHQDLTLALRDRVEHPGFGPWSIKDGIPHVQPPVEMLERMLAVRVHFDDTDESNGALRVLPGTHRMGRLSAGHIQNLRVKVPERLCIASAGDVMLMRPLLLHASGRSASAGHRRVLHIEYAGFDLPTDLAWHGAA